jgi:hypothetical protein
MVLSALRFYYWYVFSRSKYLYFGLEVDTVGLGTQDYIVRSRQPLLEPLLLLTLVGAGFVLLHSAIYSRTTTVTAPVEASNGEHDPQLQAGRIRRVEHIRRVSGKWVTVGYVMLGAGVAVLVMYSFLRDWPPYNSSHRCRSLSGLRSPPTRRDCYVFCADWRSDHRPPRDRGRRCPVAARSRARSNRRRIARCRHRRQPRVARLVTH